ncbi:peptidylprolyl isomerase [Hyphococcus lacteus]|uniref:peptidylprolyl isomerase n=1 Tax=Hyphococcus lacteus TaxID=3143536 RepID=A0ABV3Z427_9PROT
MNRHILLGLWAVSAISLTTATADELEGKRSSSEILEATAESDWQRFDPDNLVVIKLERGDVVVALSTELANNHTSQIKALAREGFYDGLSFYRVIDGFVAQGGDQFETRPLNTAMKSLAAEFEETIGDASLFSALKDHDGYAEQVGFLGFLPTGRDTENDSIWHLHCTGAMAMARDTAKNTAGTEFYITLQPQRYLDRNLSVFGRVVKGMEHLQALRRVAPAETPEDDTGEIIVSMRIAADLPTKEQPRLQYLRTDTDLYKEYVEARRNRPEDFFYFRPDHIDICAANVPVRVVADSSAKE